MVYIKKWTEYESAVTALYSAAPLRTRYCIKFSPKNGQLVLKVTDNTTCLSYKTSSSIVLNRFEALNTRLLSQMANIKPKARLLASGLEGGTAGTQVIDEEMAMNSAAVGAGLGGAEGAGTPARQGTPAPVGKAAAGGTPSGAGKKKKKKGKK